MNKIVNKLKTIFSGKINIFSNININFFNRVNRSNIVLNDKKEVVVKIPKLKKLILDDFYKGKKIDENIYQERFVNSKIENSDAEKLIFFLEDRIEAQNLKALFEEKNKICLLGNPGIGKSKELQNLFAILWKSKEETTIVPFFIDVRDFRKVTKFEDLIKFKNWKELEKIFFIIDGIDEIADIQDFVSEFENFLIQNENIEIKVVISCRTNIYEKYIINLNDFEYYYLDNLTDFQIRQILKLNFHFDITLPELNKYKVFLENPFNLFMFGDFRKEKGNFPDSIAEAFDFAIEKEIENLNKNKFIKSEKIDTSHLQKCLQKVAITNELMQQNFISENDLYNLLGEKDKSQIEKISFIEKTPNSDKLTFRHKNYQEFFSAKFLSELPIEDILNIIKISPSVNKTKPSLFNTITFLLNILDKDENKFKELKDWLFDNEPEILFLAEKDRIDIETQKEIFRKYFNDVAVEKTFWFGRDRRFSVEKIAEFADVDFLISIIKENKHFRTVKSAFDVLSFTNDNSKDEEIKILLEQIIFSENNEYLDKALQTFRTKEFYKLDNILFNKIAEKFKGNFSPDIHYYIISMLNDFQNIDDYFEILRNSLYKLYEIKPERIKDNTIRGTKWLLEKMFLRINNSENFIQILNILFNNNFDIKISDFYDKEFRQKLIEKSLLFINAEDDFLFRIIDAFLRSDDSFIHRRDNFIVELINKSSKDFNAFKYLINKYGLNDKTIYILSLFESKKCIDYLVEKFKNKDLKEQKETDINYLRMRNFNISHELGYYYESAFEAAGYIFPDKLPSQDKINDDAVKYKKIAQNNFDILFDKPKLVEEVVKVFEQNSIDKMTWSKICKIESQWYENVNNHYLQNVVYKIISKPLRNGNELSKEEIIKRIENDYLILFTIKDKIKDRSHEGFEVKSEQIEYIKNRCVEFSQKLNFEKIITIKDVERFSLHDDYYILKMLFYFAKTYDIIYSIEFYLSSLKFCNIMGNASENFEFIRQKINDDEVFNKQIFHNINNEKFDSNSLEDHIIYAIENKLKDSFNKIEKFILSKSYLRSDILNQYSAVLNNNEKRSFLESCCTDINSNLCWNAIKILKNERLSDDFILNIARRYISSENTDYLNDALNILFALNQNDSIAIYVACLKKGSEDEFDKSSGYFISDFAKYSNLNEVEILKDYFYIVYDKDKKDTFDYHYSKEGLNNIIFQLSKTEEGFQVIQRILQEIKSEIQDDDTKIFHINLLLDNSENSFYTSMSKVMNFNEVENLLKF